VEQVITAIETVEALDADWSAVVDRIAHLDPAAIMITDFIARELAAFQRLIVRRVPQALVYAIYAPSVPEFLQLVGPAAEGLVWATMTGTYSDLLGQHFAITTRARSGGHQAALMRESPTTRSTCWRRPGWPCPTPHASVP
jgi:branched-chain amino acid transport system substrate-binding protein